MKRKLLTGLLFCISPCFVHAQGYISKSNIISHLQSGGEQGSSVKVINGETWIAGTTTSSNLPVTNGSVYSGGSSGLADVFVAKFDATNNLVMASYLGTPETDYLVAFDVQSDGTMALAINTQGASFPVTDGSVHQGIDNEVVLTRLNASGNVTFGTYTGARTGAYYNTFLTFKLNLNNGAIILSGINNSSSFATTDGSTLSGDYDVFIRKYASSGSLVYSKLLGTNDIDIAGDMVVQNGTAYLLAYTDNAGFPVTDGTASTLGVFSDAKTTLTAIDATGNKVFSTYVGPTIGLVAANDGLPTFARLRADGTGIYIGMSTNDIAFPYTLGGPLNAGNGPGVSGYDDIDIVISKYTATGSRAWSRLMGSTKLDVIYFDMKVENGNLYYCAISSDQGLPIINGKAFAGGGFDGYVAKLNTNGAIVYGTYVGGSGDDGLYGSIDVKNGELFYSTTSNSLDLPTTDGSTVNSPLAYTPVVAKFKADGTMCILNAVRLLPDPSGYVLGGGEGISAVDATHVILPANYSQTAAVTTNTNTYYKTGVVQYTFCPPFTATADTLAPKTQTVCGNSVILKIDGLPIVQPGSSLPPIFSNEIPATQQDIIYKYQWQVATTPGGPWADISSAIQEDFTPDPLNASRYYRRLTKGNECCGAAIISTSDVSSVIVGPNSAPTVDAGGANGVLVTCSGSPITIGGTPTASGGTAPYQYSWTNGATAIANPLVSPTINTIYTLTVTDANGCKNNDQVIVNTYKAGAGPDKNICNGSSTQIGTAPPAGLSGLSYQWTIISGTAGSLSCSTCAQPMANPTAVSTYEVAMTVTKSDGTTCTTTDSVTVGIAAPPTANFAGNDKVLCFGQTTDLGSAPQVISTYTINAVVQHAGNPIATVANLNDNNYTTGGNTSAFPARDTIILDLGSVQTVSQLKVAALSGYAYLGQAYIVSLSPDGLNWTVALSGLPALTENSLTTFAFSEQAARYVRIHSNSAFVAISEALLLWGYNYTWSPGSYLTTNQSQATFNAGNTDMPTPNPVTYTLNASAYGCNFTDQVTVAVIKADADLDGCGPRYIGFADQTPNINETYSWSVVSGTGNFLGATNEARVPVGASTGTPTVYRLTTTYTLPGGATNTCTDDVTVPTACGASNCTIVAESSTGCPSYNLSGGNVKLIALPGDSSIYSYSWSPQAGLSNYNSRTVALTDTVQRTYTVTITSLLDPTWTCTASTTVNLPSFATPIFNATNPVQACAGVPAAIGDPSNNPGYTYTWQPNSTLSGTTGSTVVATSGSTQQYYIEVKDNVTQCLVRDTVEVIRPGKSNAGPDKTVCNQGIVQIGTVAEPGYTYSWSPSNADWRNGTDNTSAQPDVFVATQTTFILTRTHTATNCTSMDTITVNRNAPIAPFSLSDISYCPSGASFLLGYDRFTSSGSSPAVNQVPTGANYIYDWSPGGLLFSPNVRNPQMKTPLPGSPVTFNLTIANGACIQTASQAIIPAITAAQAGNDKSICMGGNTQIGSSSNTTGVGITYSWAPATGLNDPTSITPTFTPTAAGSYTFTLSRTENGCTTTDQVIVNVQEVILNAMAPQTVCSGTSLQIGPANPNPSLTYSWSPATGLSNPNIANPIATVNSSVTYTLTATNGMGCSAMQDMAIGVYSTPAPTVNVPDVTACIGDTAMFMPNVSPAGAYNYAWSPATNLSNPNIANPMVQAGIGTYTYSLTVTNQSTGCYNSVNNINAIIQPCASPSVTLSGAVLNDNTADGTVNGTGIGIIDGTKLYVSLVGTNGKVVACVPVNPDGTYVFGSVVGGQTYSIVLSTTPGIVGNTPPAASLPASGWANTGEHIGTGPGDDGNANGTILVDVNATNITDINFGIRNQTPLPIILQYFNSKATKCTAVLNWQSAKEDNLDYYEVEYTANPVGTFEPIALIKAAGTNKQYKYSHDQRTTTGYYRLKMVDYDGQYTHSKIVKVVTSGCNNIELVPTITQDKAQLKGLEGGETVRIFAIDGKEVQHFQAKSTECVINVAQHAAGTYFVVVIRGGQLIFSEKLVKQ